MGKPKKKGSAAAEPVEEVEVDVSFLLGGDSDEETAEGAASSSNGAEEAAPSEKKESKSNMSIRHNREIKVSSPFINENFHLMLFTLHLVTDYSSLALYPLNLIRN